MFDTHSHLTLGTHILQGSLFGTKVTAILWEQTTFSPTAALCTPTNHCFLDTRGFGPGNKQALAELLNRREEAEKWESICFKTPGVVGPLKKGKQEVVGFNPWVSTGGCWPEHFAWLCGFLGWLLL